MSTQLTQLRNRSECFIQIQHNHEGDGVLSVNITQLQRYPLCVPLNTGPTALATSIRFDWNKLHNPPASLDSSSCKHPSLWWAFGFEWPLIETEPSGIERSRLLCWLPITYIVPRGSHRRLNITIFHIFGEHLLTIIVGIGTLFPHGVSCSLVLDSSNYRWLLTSRGQSEDTLLAPKYMTL